MNLSTWVLAVATASCMLSKSNAPAFELTRDGRPVAVIVAETTAAPFTEAKKKDKARARAPAVPEEGSEEQAVRILVDWIRKITDAELAVTNRAPDDGRGCIRVGRAALGAGLKLDDIDSPGREGWQIVVDGHGVRIAGQSAAATVKAVCRFLEELGCRFFMDHPLGEVFPRTKSLAVPTMNLSGKPGLRYRNPKGPSWRGGYWKLWNGAGGEPLNHAHAWGRYIPKDLYTRHPEYFAMDAEGRRKDGDWLCTSNPDVRDFFARQVIAAIEAGTRNPSISPPDGRGYCRCEACRAQDDPASIEPSSGAVSVSWRYADFLDDVARRVAKVHPESILGFYAYADYTQPPALGRRLSPNLCAVIAPIRYCRLHPIGCEACPSRRQQVEMVDGWAREAGRLGYYNYMYNLADATLPSFKFTPCRTEFPWLADRGLDTMTIEILTNWHIYGPQIYLALRMAYDPRADAEAIMEDYWARFYGPAAAPHMKAYWMGIDRGMQRLSTHAGGFLGLQELYTPAFLDECRGHLDRAVAAAATDRTLSDRVALHAEGFRSAEEMGRIRTLMEKGEAAAALEAYEKMFARLKELAAKGWANPEYATAYAERFLGRNLRAVAAAVKPPARVRSVLPDEWRMAFDPSDDGAARRFHETDFDDSAWTPVRTYSRTLSSQGLSRTDVLWFRARFDVPAGGGRCSLMFCEVDGAAEVYVNGRKPAVTAPGQSDGGVVAPKRREAFEAAAGDAIKPGSNVVAVRVDNRAISELFLGGLLRPVWLVER